MSLGIFVINDVGVQVSLNENVIEISPGYAVVHNDTTFVGSSGRSKFKLFPRWTSNRFWSELNTSLFSEPSSFVDPTFIEEINLV